MRKYTKAFEAYWKRVGCNIGNVEPWQSSRVKHAAFLAWQAGRRAILKERREHKFGRQMARLL